MQHRPNMSMASCEITGWIGREGLEPRCVVVVLADWRSSSEGDFFEKVWERWETMEESSGGHGCSECNDKERSQEHFMPAADWRHRLSRCAIPRCTLHTDTREGT